MYQWIVDNATKKLDQQEDNQRSNHKELLNDLAVIRSKAREVWKKIGEFTLLDVDRTP